MDCEPDCPEANGAEGYTKDLCGCGNIATHSHGNELCCGGEMCCPDANM